MQTYFISDGMLIKIGKSLDPASRLAHFQTSHARPLTIRLILITDRERELHQRFAGDHVRGEWFRLSYDIEKFILEQSGEYRKPSFYAWLTAQQSRSDRTGRFAYVACHDHSFPKTAQTLHVLLKYYDDIPSLRRVGSPKLRKELRYAHKEWRHEIRRQKDYVIAKKISEQPRLVKPSKDGRTA